jgi:protein-S-isoprenylcysteine O-methyltransferase Ste14
MNRHPLDIPPLYFGLAILSMVALHRFLPLADLIERPWSHLGWLPIAAGVLLAVWAERLFKRAGTGVRPFTPSTAVVETGPYQFSRNPMYLGMVLVLAGVFLLLGSITSLLVMPLFIWLIHRRFVLHEERHMETHLGDAYLAFKRRVRRWI